MEENQLFEKSTRSNEFLLTFTTTSILTYLLTYLHQSSKSYSQNNSV